LENDDGDNGSYRTQAFPLWKDFRFSTQLQLKRSCNSWSWWTSKTLGFH